MHSFKSLLKTCAIIILSGSSTFGAVTLTGDPTTTTGVTFTKIGNSQDSGIKADSVNSGYAYDIYTGVYTVSAGDTLSGANIIGNTAQGATGGAFTVGSQIMIIGWKATTPNIGGSIATTSDGFFKFDATLTGGYKPASIPGGPSTSFTANSVPGDFQLQTSRNNFAEYRVTSFRFYQSAMNNSTYPLQTGGVAGGSFIPPLDELAFRTFGVNAATPGDTPMLTSQLILLNLTELNGQTFGGTPVNPFGPVVIFYMQQGNASGNTGAVITASTVPEPATIGFVILGLVAALFRKRRTA